MTDGQIEMLLRRFQVQGPPLALRDRVLARGGRARRVPLEIIDWSLIAAAAALVIAFAWPHPDANPSLDSLAAIYRERLEAVAVDLGGDAQARQLAAIVVASPAELVEEEP